jgi:Helix-turn-helix domain
MTLPPLPLANASKRLRERPAPKGLRDLPGKLGRPRRRSRPEIELASPEPSLVPHQGRAPPARPTLTPTSTPGAPETRPISGLAPRLLGVREAAVYLAVSEWSIREWIAQGVLPRIAIALPVTTKRRGGEYRRLLVDRADLDSLVERGRVR